jgi:hypothetical protein
MIAHLRASSTNALLTFKVPTLPENFSGNLRGFSTALSCPAKRNYTELNAAGQGAFQKILEKFFAAMPNGMLRFMYGKRQTTAG